MDDYTPIYLHPEDYDDLLQKEERLTLMVAAIRHEQALGNITPELAERLIDCWEAEEDTHND